MSELEFYDGAWSGQEIDAGIGLTGTLSSALAIVVDGNKSTISASYGQYVLVKNSTIANVSDGLYTAAQTIPANTAIDATYLTAVSGGGLNALASNVFSPFVPTQTAETDLNNVGAGVWWANSSVANLPTSTTYVILSMRYSSSGSNQGIQIAFRRSSDGTYIRRLNNGTWSAWKQFAYTT